jgi:hypothetical protein
MDGGFERTNLIAEVQRYLAVVESFRAEGCRLVWFSESPPDEQTGEATTPVATRAWLERG